MAGPWEAYQQQPSQPAPADGPWSAYQPQEKQPEVGLTSTEKVATQPDSFGLRNPISLWKEDSLPAHLVNAYKKGTFHKPLKELVANVRDDVKDFKISDLWHAAQEHPKQFAGELINSVVADPELLLPLGGWLGLGGRMAAKSAQFGKAARVAGKAVGLATEAGAEGALMSSATSAAQQLDKRGHVSMQQLMQDTKAGATFSAALGTGLHLGADILKVKPQAVWQKVKEKVAAKPETNHVEAIQEAFAELGMPEEHSEPIIEALKDHQSIEDANKAHQKAIREQAKADRDMVQGMSRLAKDVAGPAPETQKTMTKAQLSRDFVQRRRELEGQAAVSKASEDELQNMLGGLKAHEIETSKAREQAMLDEMSKLAGPGSNAKEPITEKPASLKEMTVSLQKQEALKKANESEFDKLMSGVAEAQGKEEQRQIKLAQEELTRQSRIKQDAVKEAAEARAADLQTAKNNLDNLTKKPMSRSVIVGSADAARLKPEFQRSADDLIALQREKLAKEGVNSPIEIPQTYRVRESGQIDPRMLKLMAIAGAGGTLGGYYSDDKVEGAAIGAGLALGGLAALKVGKALFDRVETKLDGMSIGPRDTRYRIDHLREPYQATVAEHGLSARKAENGFKGLVSDVKRREDFTHFIETGDPKLAPRTKEEALYVDQMRKGNEGILKREQAAGVMGEGITDGSYIAHFFTGSEKEVNRAVQVFNAMSAKNPHAMKRVLPSYRMLEKINQDLVAAGKSPLKIKPKTLDSAEIFRMRMERSGTAIARAKLKDSLKTEKTPAGEALLAPRGSKEAAGYKDIIHPVLMNYQVHPDIAPSLKLLYTANDPGPVFQALELVNNNMRRVGFSYSMFHNMTMGFALAGAGPKSWAKLPAAHRAVMGKNHALLREAVVEGGVRLDLNASEKDSVSKAMQKGIDITDKYFSPAGLPLKAADKIDRSLHKLTWQYQQPVSKVAVYAAEVERGLAENVQLAKEGKPVVPEKQIRKNAGSFANDLFGKINWAEMAESIQNKWGRSLALALAQPGAQRWLSLLDIAPDWFLSTTRAIVKAIPGVSNKQLARMHRRYIFNHALGLMTIGEAINYAMSGHGIEDNKDPTRLDLGDGRTMQWDKPFFEFFQFLRDPAQGILSKEGFAISEINEQLEGVEYLKAHGKAPKMEGLGARAKHLVKKVLPISVGQDDITSGFFGLPIYGKKRPQ